MDAWQKEKLPLLTLSFNFSFVLGDTAKLQVPLYASSSKFIYIFVQISHGFIFYEAIQQHWTSELLKKLTWAKQRRGVSTPTHHKICIHRKQWSVPSGILSRVLLWSMTSGIHMLILLMFFLKLVKEKFGKLFVGQCDEWK